MKRILLPVLAGLVFWNCNNSAGWTSAQQEKSMKECVQATAGKIDETLAKKYCSCVLDKAMKKYKSYSEAEKASNADGIALAQACMQVLQGGGGGDMPVTGDDGGGNTNDNNGGGLFGGGGGGGSWSNTDRKNFVSQCASAVEAKGYSQAQARQLCTCAMEKLEAKYSSLADADQRGGQQAGREAMQACTNGDNTMDDGGQQPNGEENP